MNPPPITAQVILGPLAEKSNGSDIDKATSHMATYNKMATKKACNPLPPFPAMHPPTAAARQQLPAVHSAIPSAGIIRLTTSKLPANMPSNSTATASASPTQVAFPNSVFHDIFITSLKWNIFRSPAIYGSHCKGSLFSGLAYPAKRANCAKQTEKRAI